MLYSVLKKKAQLKHYFKNLIWPTFKVDGIEFHLYRQINRGLEKSSYLTKATKYSQSQSFYPGRLILPNSGFLI